MASSGTVVSEREVLGLDELEKALLEFPDVLVRKILRGAYGAGLKVMKGAALERVPVASGDLRDSIRVSTSSRGGTVTGFLKAGNKKAWYVSFVEFGTAAHFIQAKNKKALSFQLMTVEGVHHPGSKKEPFMRPALDAAADAAVDAFAAYIRNRIDRERDLAALRNSPDQPDLKDQ